MFDLIAPYLSLVDILNISKISQRWKRIFERYIKDEKRITIDDHLLQNFPLETNEDLYCQFKQARDILMRRIPECEVSKLVKCFVQIDNFTVSEMVILEDYKVLPVSLYKLTISKTKFAKKELQEWLKEMKNTLDTLYLDRIQTDCYLYPSSLYEINFLETPRLKHLRIRGDDIVMWFKSLTELRSLSVVANTFKYNLSGCRYMEYFKQIHFDAVNVSSLWSFLSQGIAKPEYVKLVRSVDPIHTNTILKTFNMITFDVNYLEYASPEQPDQIIQVLNDDCLVHITQYLSLKDCFSFAQTHSRIEDVIIRNRFKVLKSEKTVHDILYERPEFIERMAPFIRHLQIHTYMDYLWDQLPLFTALKSLSLSGVSLSGQRLARIPTTLDSLSLWEVTVPKGFKSLGTYLSRLRNIREFVFDTSLNQEWIETFLENNRDTLEHIGVAVGHKEPLETLTIDWHWVKAFPKLKHFTLKRNSVYRDGGTNDQTYLSGMLTILETRIQKLTLQLSPKELEAVIYGASLEHLPELEVIQCDPLNSYQIYALRGFKGLRKLTLKSSWGCQTGMNVEDAILCCRKLTHLSLSKLKSDFGIEGWLERMGRKIEVRQLANTAEEE